MERDERQFPSLDAIDDGVADFLRHIVMPPVSPPNQHVGFVEDLRRNTVIRLVQIG